MCRFVMYLGPELTLDQLTTRPAHSLIHQSYKAREREEPLNGDGFGVAWYAAEGGEEAAVFRSTTPAWSNPNLRELARVTKSACVLAHVRAATPPLPVIELNCHPFKSGSLVLMHNGFIPSFGRVRRKLLSELSDDAFNVVRGSTDSEHILGLFHDRYHQLQDRSGAARLEEALRQTLRRVEALCREEGIERAPRLNVAVSDGTHAVASRCCADEAGADSLYVHEGKAYVCEDGGCRMVDPEGEGGSVIVASEPLSEDPGWEAVPINHLAIIDADRAVTLRAI